MAQTENEQQQPLTDILRNIEQRFGINFTFADANVQGIKITAPSDVLNLEETIEYLSTETVLLYSRLDNNSFVIRKKSETKYPALKKGFRLQVLDEVVITDYLTQGITKPNDGTVAINPQEFAISRNFNVGPSRSVLNRSRPRAIRSWSRQTSVNCRTDRILANPATPNLDLMKH